MNKDPPQRWQEGPAKETRKRDHKQRCFNIERDSQKRPIKETYQCGKEVYKKCMHVQRNVKKDPQKRRKTKDTHKRRFSMKRDSQKRPMKETYQFQQRDPPQR